MDLLFRGYGHMHLYESRFSKFGEKTLIYNLLAGINYFNTAEFNNCED